MCRHHPPRRSLARSSANDPIILPIGSAPSANAPTATAPMAMTPSRPTAGHGTRRGRRHLLRHGGCRFGSHRSSCALSTAAGTSPSISVSGHGIRRRPQPAALDQLHQQRQFGVGQGAEVDACLFAFFWLGFFWFPPCTLQHQARRHHGDPAVRVVHALDQRAHRRRRSLPRELQRFNIAMWLVIPVALSGHRLGPVASGERGDPVGHSHELVPAVTTCVDDRLVAVPDAVAEIIAAHEFPDVFHRI